jgi:hypothetical protein
MLRMVTLVTGPKWAKTSRTTPAEGKWFGSCDFSVLSESPRGSVYDSYGVLSARDIETHQILHDDRAIQRRGLPRRLRRRVDYPVRHRPKRLVVSLVFNSNWPLATGNWQLATHSPRSSLHPAGSAPTTHRSYTP